MVRLSRILKDYREAGTLSDMIALWGFVGDAIFLTKAGGVGIAYRLTPPDTECMDPADRSASARIALLKPQEAFTFFRRLCNYADWKADAAPQRYNAYLDCLVADSTLECHRSHLRLDDYYVRVLTMKEPPSSTRAWMLDALHRLLYSFIACAEWQRLPADHVRREIRARRRHHFNRRISLVNYISPDTKPEHMLVDESATNIVSELGQCLSCIDVEGRAFGAASLSIVIYDSDASALQPASCKCTSSISSWSRTSAAVTRKPN